MPNIEAVATKCLRDQCEAWQALALEAGGISQLPEKLRDYVNSSRGECSSKSVCNLGSYTTQLQIAKIRQEIEEFSDAS